MIWTIVTILLLIIGIALFLVSSLLFADSKKTSGGNIVKKLIDVVAVVLITGCVCRLYTPYYLTKVNPSIVKDMILGMQEQQAAEKNKAISKYINENQGEMMADAPVWGDENAKKTMYLFSDYACPYCRRLHAELAKVMEKRKDVRLVLKNFPLQMHGEMAEIPAKAAIAAKLQGNDKAVALDKLLMEKGFFKPEDMKDRSKLGAKIHKNVMALAVEAGLNVEQLERDMKGAVVARELNNVFELADRFEIGGTPFLIINDKPADNARRAADIEAELDK